MKKIFFSLMMMAMGSTLVTSCLNDDDNNNGKNSQTLVVTKGIYVVNNGTWNQNNGSLTYFDYSTMQAQQLLNGATGLGDTPNDAYTKGDTVFVAGSTENTIFVLDKNFNIISRVNTVAEMGEAEGYSPRHLTGLNNKIYFTTYGGYVGELDAKTLKVTDRFQVGSVPEGITVGGTTASPVLFVANSDYGNGKASISKITLSSGAVETITNEKIQNPQEIVAIGDSFYYLDWGHYDENWNQIDAGLYFYTNGNVTQVVKNATGLGVGMVYINGSIVGYNLITFSNPYGSTSAPVYSKVNTYTSPTSFTTLTLTGDDGYEIVSPAAIAVDPITGNIVIASRSLDPDTGYASYTLPGYANMYSEGGKYLEGTHFQTDIEPHMIGFTLGTQTFTY